MATQTSRSPVDVLTRIVAGGDRTRYDGFSIGLHWLIVALVLIQFGLARTWGLFGKPARHEMVALHMSFGIVLTTVVIARMVWRFLPGHAVPSAVQGLTEIAARTVHWILYGMLLGQAGLGFALPWSSGEAIRLFGLPIAPMIPRLSKSTHHLIAAWHNWVGWAIIIFAAGHAAAALWHHFIVRDRVLMRILPRRWSA